MSVFVLSSALNYLDRQILAALAPLVRAEFHMTNADYGQLLAVFSITYAISSPLAGLLIDRFGLNRSVGFAVGLWSMSLSTSSVLLIHSFTPSSLVVRKV